MAKTVFDDTPPTGTIVTDDFLNALNNHRHTGRDIDGDGAIDYAVATGSGNAYAVALSPALDAHIAGMPVVMKANHTNTGAATVNINSLGAIAIKRPDGSALQANDILSGQVVVLVYDGTYYQLITLAEPEVLLADFASSLNQNGYQKLPGGFILQWGIYSSEITDEGEISITFPLSFPTSCFVAIGNILNADSSTSNDTWLQPHAVSQSGVTFYAQGGFSSAGNGDGFMWIAIGK